MGEVPRKIPAVSGGSHGGHMTGVHNDNITASLKAPFPWFGGKSRVADLVWDRFGDVANYVEPFAGSLAVLLRRPTEPRVETVNDLDCYLANFWRAVTNDPEQVATHADWPVNEADLHARHLWLVKQDGFRERMKTDPDFFDAKIAGWWVWGISQWIGSGWCQHPEWRGRGAAFRVDQAYGFARQNIHRTEKLFGHSGGMGVHRKRVATMTEGKGVHVPDRKRPELSQGGHHPNGRAYGNGGVFGEQGLASDGLYTWFSALAHRLRRVRVCCGDWKRVMGPAVTTCIGTTGLFLDPPYSVADRSDVYSHESRDVAHDVRDWALANGDNPDLRIALCGYEGEHEMPDTWERVAWKAAGGYGSQGNGAGRENAGRERVWFSPACLTAPLFAGLQSW